MSKLIFKILLREHGLNIKNACVCACVCVCVREREREKERVFVYECMHVCM